MPGWVHGTVLWITNFRLQTCGGKSDEKLWMAPTLVGEIQWFKTGYPNAGWVNPTHAHISIKPNKALSKLHGYGCTLYNEPFPTFSNLPFGLPFTRQNHATRTISKSCEHQHLGVVQVYTTAAHPVDCAGARTLNDGPRLGWKASQRNVVVVFRACPDQCSTIKVMVVVCSYKL